MANGYKAPKGLGSAVRGRSMVTRDYTAGIKQKAADREATLGLVQSIAGGVAAASSAIGQNIKSWEQAEKGAKAVFESSGIEGSFDTSGYEGADNWTDRWFKSAGEEVKTQTIGGKEFSVADLMSVGRADRVSATRMGTAIKDETGSITGYKSLYESLGTDTATAAGGITSTTTSPPVESQKESGAGRERAMRGAQREAAEKSGTQVIKDEVAENQKQNATGGLAPEVDEPSYKQWKEIAGNEDKRMADYFEQYPTLG